MYTLQMRERQTNPFSLQIGKRVKRLHWSSSNQIKRRRVRFLKLRD